MSLLHSPHSVVTFFHSCLLLFQSSSASSSLTCITVFFPFLPSALHLANVFLLFSLLYVILLLSSSSFPFIFFPLLFSFLLFPLSSFGHAFFFPQRTQSQRAQSTSPDGNPKSRKGLPLYVTASLRAKMAACRVHVVHGGSLSLSLD